MTPSGGGGGTEPDAEVGIAPLRMAKWEHG